MFRGNALLICDKAGKQTPRTALQSEKTAPQRLGTALQNDKAAL
jgi:hypothetical protein